MENHIFIYNEIGEFGNTADQVQADINSLPNADKLIVHISSPGGDVFAGWTIGNILKNSGKRVEVIIEGLCASIATYIALQADSISMASTARFMIHNPATMVAGEEKDLKVASEQLASIKSDLIKTYKAKTKMDDKTISDMMNDGTWLTPTQAKEMGFIDSIIDNVKAVAKFNINNLSKMENKEESNKVGKASVSKLEKAFNDMMSALNKWTNNEILTVWNVDIKLSDGTVLFVESEDGELEGKMAYLADEEGNKSENPAPAGTHELEDGRSIVVSEGGMIESVEESSPEDQEKIDLQNKVAELTAQIEANNVAKVEAENALSEQFTSFKNSMVEMKKELDSIKSMTAGGEPTVVKAHTPASSTNVVQTSSNTDKLKNWQLNTYNVKK